MLRRSKRLALRAQEIIPNLPDESNTMLRRSKRLALRAQEIIPNLPDDIARHCLLRVPYKWHSTLKLVCRKWKEIVSDPKFYKDRMTTGTAEQLICMIKIFGYACRIVVLDPVTRTLEILRQNLLGTDLSRCGCVCLNGKLVFVGCSRNKNAVYIFDFASAEWRRGTNMPTRRHSFACSVSSSDGLIYVAGGIYVGSMLFAAEAYNVEEDRWQILPPVTQQQGACRGVFLEEKFFVFDLKPGNSAEIFDPKTGIWTRVDNMWRLKQWFKLSSIVASGHLYTPTETQLMKYNAEGNDWAIQSVLSTKFPRISCTAEWQGHIFATQHYTSGTHCQFCYLLNPSTNELIEFEVPENFAGGTISAATVEI